MPIRYATCYLRDVTLWTRPRPHDAKSKPVDIHLAVFLFFFLTMDLLYEYLGLVDQSSSNVQTRDVSVLQSDWPLAHGGSPPSACLS